MTTIKVARKGEVFDVLVDDQDIVVVSQYRWRIHPRGYVMGRKIGNHRDTVHMHRLVMTTMMGRVPIGDVDHINGCEWDNRRENLRECTHAQNCQNRHGAQSTSTTGIRGVGWDRSRGMFTADIKVNGQRIRLGRFKTASEAESVVKAARTRHMPFSSENVR